jgi:DNA-binding NarL/FixJ family response regulator
LMAEGRSNARISRQLGVTDGTVEKHVRSILIKLRVPGPEEVTAGCWPCRHSSTRVRTAR